MFQKQPILPGEGDSRSKVIRTKREAYHTDCLRKKVKFPASIMAWGCMSVRGVGNLDFVQGTVNAEKYIEILNQHLLPSIESLQSINQEYIFQHDGAPCHKAKRVKSWMSENNIPLLDWASSSADLSLIKTLWNQMKKQVRKHPARTIQELRDRLQEIWN